MTLDLDYKKIEVHISMLDYMAEAQIRFEHNAPKKLQDQPHPHINPKYGETAQYSKEKDTPPPPVKYGIFSSKV